MRESVAAISLKPLIHGDEGLKKGILLLGSSNLTALNYFNGMLPLCYVFWLDKHNYTCLGFICFRFLPLKNIKTILNISPEFDLNLLTRVDSSSTRLAGPLWFDGIFELQKWLVKVFFGTNLAMLVLLVCDIPWYETAQGLVSSSWLAVCILPSG